MINKIAIAALLSCAVPGLAMAADLMVEPAGIVETGNASLFAGDVSGYVGYLRLEDYYDDAYSFDGSNWGIAARGNIPLADSFAMQVDLSAESLQGYFDYATLDAAMHLNWRQDGNLVGVFGSVGADQNIWDTTFGTIGVEGVVTLDNLQFYGQVGYSADLEDNTNVNAVYGRGEVRYFATPNLVATASLGAVREDYSDGDDVIEGVNWGASLEYRLDDSPLSIYAAYQGNYDKEADEDESWAVHALMVGAKFSFGTDSLQEAATKGATLRDHNPLSGYGMQRYNDYE